MLRDRFRAMGTSVELAVDADRAEFSAARAELERLEQVMSRFRPDSELSRLNRDGEIDASPDLVDVVTRALDARDRTEGRFDPTVHDALIAAGYDRDYDELPADGPAPEGADCGGDVHVSGRRIRLADGVRLDLGGIGKGFAAERIAELLALDGPALVDTGGDIAVRGIPKAGAWIVGVDDQVTLAIDHGGVATSGLDRRWRRGGSDQHHLIDPRTGRPAQTDLVRVTAVGSDAVEAEVLAKTLLLAGVDEASSTDVPAVLHTADGRTIRTGGL